MRAIYWKELADHFGRRRFSLLLGMVLLGVAWGSFIDMDRLIITGAGFFFLDIFTSKDAVPLSLLDFIAFFGPILGIALGFDSINGERTQGTLSRLLAQPVYRDAVFNGKFLAGLTTLGIVVVSLGLTVIGIAMFRIGVPPGGDEVLRLVGFGLLATVYLAFWLALAMTASIFLRTAVASALVSIGLWMGASFFILLAATAIADQVVSDVETVDDAQRRFTVERWIARASPGELFSEATGILLDPMNGRALSISSIQAFEPSRFAGLLASPVSASQSLQLVWPHIVVLIAMIAILLAISYVRFMREEIRA
jgi:ABC-2 type transport system permease protein